MKTMLHTITVLLLMALSAMAGPFLKVRTEKQRAVIEAQVHPNQELRVFIGDESLGWSATGPQTGVAISATVEASSEIRLDDGSLGKGFIFRAGGRTMNVAITPGGPVPFGEFVIRDESKVTGKAGTATFADIRKPDGTLVPVSVGVRTLQVSPHPTAAPVTAPAAATKQPLPDEFSALHFRVLEITRHGEPINGKQTIVLRVAPHYGKIETKSHDFRLKHESQELSFVMAIDTGCDIHTNDIIGLQVGQHIKVDR